MSRHTPGPWHVEERHHVYAVCCKPTRKGEHPEVVFVERHGQAGGGSITSQYRTDDELAGNARLIAAAPDYHKAVADLLELWPLSGYELEAYMAATFIPAARAAIAKAEGGK